MLFYKTYSDNVAKLSLYNKSIFRNQSCFSINGKRSKIEANDILKLADAFTIKNPKGIIKHIQSYREALLDLFGHYDIPKLISEKINDSIIKLI